MTPREIMKQIPPVSETELDTAVAATGRIRGVMAHDPTAGKRTRLPPPRPLHKWADDVDPDSAFAYVHLRNKDPEYDDGNSW